MITMTLTKEEKRHISEIEDRLEAIEKKLNAIFALAKGIAIGLVVGGIVFGYFTFKDLLDVAK